MALFLVGIVACTKDTLQSNLELEEGITLTLECAAPQTRATIDGVTDLNENKIENIYYFFYPKDPSNPSADNFAQDPEFWGKMTGLNSQNQQVIRLNYTEYNINYEIFPRPFNTCDVYVVANIPEGVIENLPDRKLETIRAIALNANFGTKLTQDNFVMEGLGTAEIIDRKNKIAATGTISINRVASKISVRVMVAENVTPADNEIDVNGRTWTSEPESMRIEFVNGVNNAVLSGDPTAVNQFSTFTTDKNSREFNDDNTDQLWECHPFYSYPSKWDIGGETEPYLRITMPWKTIINTEVDGQQRPVTEYRNCYYKIILGGDMLKRNTWYDLTINIGILGSFDEQEEILIPLSNITYYVQNWSTGLDINSDILGGRYLVVERDTFKLYNETLLEIPFTSSHNCVITNESCKHPNLMTGQDVDGSNYSLTISEDGKKIIYENPLDNNMNSATFDFTPYTTKLTLQHTDDNKYKKEIVIIQYPAIYAEAQPNTDYGNGGQANTDKGFVWVNGYQGSSANSGNDFFGSVPGRSNTSADPNMYVFTISTTEGTNYVIGDPRDMNYTYNESSANWNRAKAIYDNNQNRELKYYYGTMVASPKYTNATSSTGIIYSNDAQAEAAEPTINMIAPKFRLASGYAVLSTDATAVRTLENLKKRCASYQEDGYPAGRWRLPTRAEFQFIMTQIELGNLPTVYIDNTTYWCAHGTGTPNNGVVNMSYRGYDSNGHSVRCVYDEWYWENSNSYRLGTKNNNTFTPSDTFTWGDMPREAFN